MNLLILQPEDFTSESEASITGRRAKHIIAILKAQPGDTVTVGQLNGNTGIAQITSIKQDAVVLAVPQLSSPPPATIPVQLILGLPRPRMLHRLLQTITTMGVETVHLLQTARVEKSYWQTPLLEPSSVHEQLILGLEQAKATQMPTIHRHQRFIPFMEDTLPSLLPNTQKYIAHPGNYPLASHCPQQPTLLAIGPEGGFIDKEVEHFVNAGFEPLQLGERILKVETAVPVAIAKLF